MGVQQLLRSGAVSALRQARTLSELRQATIVAPNGG
jgi:hypothetical protein